MQPPQIGGSIKLGALEKIATNKYFIGVVMILMNIGARFMIEELTKEKKKLVNKYLDDVINLSEYELSVL